MDYIATSGPLHQFANLYDPRLKRVEGVGDLPVIQLSGAGAKDPARATFLRDPPREFSFMSLVIGTLAKGTPLFLVYRSVLHSSGVKLISALQGQSKIRWSCMKYSPSEDDFILCELKDFRSDMSFVMPFHPPRAGELLIYAVKEPFDAFDIQWQRRAQFSLKAREEPFRYDFLSYMAQATYVMHCDMVGTFNLVRQEGLHSNKAVISLLQKAATRVEMELSIAPALFS